tara:strand:- start:1314 stop:1496 length:183 start_codon:yes stop_codon:yes gene_type:complete
MQRPVHKSLFNIPFSLCEPRFKQLKWVSPDPGVRYSIGRQSPVNPRLDLYQSGCCETRIF